MVDINVVYVVCAAAIIIFMNWLLAGPMDRKPYRCTKCGFETYSETEAAGHEKMENVHKCA